MAKVIEKQAFSGSMDDIRVLERLERLLIPLRDVERDGLERNILRCGRPNDSLKLWGDILVDGHNRYRICLKHDLPFKVEQIWEHCETIEDVEFEIRDLQASQRNASVGYAAELRAANVHYEVVVKGKSKQQAIKETAERHGISERQVHRNVARNKKILEMDSDVQQSPAIRELTDKQVENLSLLSAADQKAAIERAGNDGDNLKNELKRMESVEGSVLFNAEKDRQQKIAAKNLKEQSGLALFPQFSKQLAAAVATWRAIKKEFGIKKGTFDRILGLLDKAEEDVVRMKPE